MQTHSPRYVVVVGRSICAGFMSSREACEHAAALRTRGAPAFVQDREADARKQARRTTEAAQLRTGSAPVCVGWRVLDRGRPLSRTFVAHEAAEEVAALARSEGRTVSVESVLRSDSAGGLF